MARHEGTGSGRTGKGPGGEVVVLPEVAPTPERRKQLFGLTKEYEPEAPRSRRLVMRHRAKCENWLDVYLLEGKIDGEQHEAGIRLRAAWLFLLRGVKYGPDSLVPRVGAGNAEDFMDRLSISDRIIRDFFAESGLPFEQKMVILKVCQEDRAAGTERDVVLLRRGLDVMVRLWVNGFPVTRQNRGKKN